MNDIVICFELILGTNKQVHLKNITELMHAYACFSLSRPFYGSTDPMNTCERLIAEILYHVHI